MCGIFGIVTQSEQHLGSLLTEAGRRLSYRGYDSVGCATITNHNSIDLRKDIGKILKYSGMIKWKMGWKEKDKMKLLTEINGFLRKRYNIGFLKNYPYRTSTEFVKKYFGDKEIVCIEIGTFEGDNAINLLRKVPNIKKLYLIDPYIFVKPVLK